jgi:hypothetical protein
MNSHVTQKPAGASGTGDRPLVPAAPFAALDGFEAKALALLLDALAQSSWRCNGREHPMTVEFWGLADEIRGKAA